MHRYKLIGLLAQLRCSPHVLNGPCICILLAKLLKWKIDFMSEAEAKITECIFVSAGFWLSHQLKYDTHAIIYYRLLFWYCYCWFYYSFSFVCRSKTENLVKFSSTFRAIDLYVVRCWLHHVCCFYYKFNEVGWCYFGISCLIYWEGKTEVIV